MIVKKEFTYKVGYKECGLKIMQDFKKNGEIKNKIFIISCEGNKTNNLLIDSEKIKCLNYECIKQSIIISLLINDIPIEVVISKNGKINLTCFDYGYASKKVKFRTVYKIFLRACKSELVQQSI